MSAPNPGEAGVRVTLDHLDKIAVMRAAFALEDEGDLPMSERPILAVIDVLLSNCRTLLGENAALVSREAALVARVERLEEALRFYADERNWTNHEDWPDGEDGYVVFSRDSVRRDMVKNGWHEASAALARGGEAKGGA